MSNKTKFVKAICSLAVFALVAGCSTIEEAEKNTQVAAENTKRIIKDNADQAAPAGIARSDNPRITGKEIVLRKRADLPSNFGTQVVYTSHGVQKFNEILEEISSRTGVSITGAEIVQAQQATQNANGGGVQAGGVSGNTQLQDFVQIEYSGTLKGLLDELAARNMASWRYVARSNSVEFFRFETRTFNMHLPGGSKQLAASISLSGAGGGSGGGSSGGGGGGGGSSGGSGGSGEGAGTVSVSQTQTIDPWRSVMTSVEAILGTSGRSNAAFNGQGQGGQGGASISASTGGSGGGGSARGGMGGQSANNSSLTASGADGFATATPELGIITVTARPHAQQRIEGLLASINERFARNVMIDVSIYNVTLSREQSAGVSMDLIYKRLNGNGLSIAGSAPLAPNTGIPGQLTLSIANPNSRWKGSEIVADALSSVGSVALYKKGQILAINGQPSPFQVVDDITYASGTNIAQTANVGTQTSVSQSTLTTGFTANVQPLILGDNRILLQYQIELSSVTSMTPVVSAGSTIYSPNVARQSFQQQAFLKDGDSIVLFGFDSGSDESNGNTGMTGLSKLGKGERKMSVIVMQVSGGRKNG